MKPIRHHEYHLREVACLTGIMNNFCHSKGPLGNKRMLRALELSLGTALLLPSPVVLPHSLPAVASDCSAGSTAAARVYFRHQRVLKVHEDAAPTPLGSRGCCRMARSRARACASGPLRRPGQGSAPPPGRHGWSVSVFVLCRPCMEQGACACCNVHMFIRSHVCDRRQGRGRLGQWK